LARSPGGGPGLLPPAGRHGPRPPLLVLAPATPRLISLADSRQGLGSYPPLIFKMNASEFALLTGRSDSPAELFDHIPGGAAELAKRNGHPVFITLAERGIIGAAPGVKAVHVPALPVRGPIDIVGAGDTVTASTAFTLPAVCGSVPLKSNSSESPALVTVTWIRWRDPSLSVSG